MITHIITSLIFILLILLLLWSNEDTFETVGNELKYKYDTIYNKLANGYDFYQCLGPNENLEYCLRNKEKALVLFLAPWCKESKKIKRDNIKTISKKIPVIVVDDKHPNIDFFINTFNIENFPCILLYEDKKITKKSIKYLRDIH